LPTHFLEKARHLLTLRKNIPYSSQQYLSNVTFGAILAFQMRKEYVFEEKK
jgi:hypothetical protein